MHASNKAQKGCDTLRSDLSKGLPLAKEIPTRHWQCSSRLDEVCSTSISLNLPKEVFQMMAAAAVAQRKRSEEESGLENSTELLRKFEEALDASRRGKKIYIV